MTGAVKQAAACTPLFEGADGHGTVDVGPLPPGGVIAVTEPFPPPQPGPEPVPPNPDPEPAPKPGEPDPWPPIPPVPDPDLI